MKHVEDMTPEELRAWQAGEAEKSRRRFAGQPLPEISRVKAADYPHLERSQWGFALWAGSPLRIWRGARDAQDATVLGLRPVSDGGPLALLVRAADRTVWALRRHDGQAQWAERTTTRWASTKQLQVPVQAWPVEHRTDEDTDAVLELPGRPQDWLVQSDQLDVRS